MTYLPASSLHACMCSERAHMYARRMVATEHHQQLYARPCHPAVDSAATLTRFRVVEGLIGPAYLAVLPIVYTDLNAVCSHCHRTCSCLHKVDCS